MSDPLRTRRGVALLEALVALVILGVVSTVLLAATASAYRVVVVARETESTLRAASRLLDAATLWSRAELDQRLGDRVQGPMVMRIDRITPTVYQLSLRDSANSQELLRTAVYRVAAADAGY